MQGEINTDTFTESDLEEVFLGLVAKRAENIGRQHQRPTSNKMLRMSVDYYRNIWEDVFGTKAPSISEMFVKLKSRIAA